MAQKKKKTEENGGMVFILTVGNIILNVNTVPHSTFAEFRSILNFDFMICQDSILQLYTLLPQWKI